MLILGGSGFVGRNLTCYSINDYDLHLTVNTNRIKIDNVPVTQVDLLKNKHIVINLIKNLNPDIVVNTVGHPNVDLCETNHKIADTLHVDIPTDISTICKDTDSKLIQFSTDAVFDSDSIQKFTENDMPNPKNYYGHSRLNAEKIILNKSRKNVVLRTAVIFGWNKKSRFTNWIIKSLQDHEFVDPHNDQYNTPTLVDDLSKVILKIIEQNISGLYHATGKTCLSRYDFSKELATGFNLDQKFIHPVTSQVKKQIAPRPYCSCLDSSKLEKKSGFNFSDIKSAISYVYKKSQE